MDKDLLNKNHEILEHYGFEKQAIVWIEELSELTKEITKRLRKGCFTKESLEDMKFEVTDAQVCLDQIKKAIGYPLNEQEEKYKCKIERQLDRISKE